MTDLDRLLELAEKKGEKGLWTNEYPELKSKIEQDLEYWQKYKDETREVEHIISKRNLELYHIKRKIKELEQQNKELQEKADKWDNLIESFTFDFNPIDDIEEVARQFIDNEIRTTHKLYEENKRLKEELESMTKYSEMVMTDKDLERYTELIKSIYSGYPTNKDCKPQKELDALKSKIEQDLKYWQKYKDETREVEHIITKRNLELYHIKHKIKELEQQVKTGQQLCKTYEDTIEEQNEEYKSIKEFFTLELEEKNDEIKRLKEEIKRERQGWAKYRHLKQKLEKIESKLKEIDSEEGHDVMFCSVEWIEEILRGKEE